VGKFFKRDDELERELRSNRPEPRAEFLAAIVGRVEAGRRPTAPRLRLGFAAALTVGILSSLAAFGGLGYAASAARSIAHVATKLATPSKLHATQQPLSSAGAQYSKKITICHFDGKGRGHTITIDQSAWPAHRAHGDHEGPCRAGEFKPGSAANPLVAPADGARVTAPPTLHWRPAPGATYYNVQLFRGGRKVLSLWPGSTRVTLKRQWVFGGQSVTLSPGAYRWYVWPGYGAHRAQKYGSLLGSSTFKLGG
jgi:hypothetical protein